MMANTRYLLYDRNMNHIAGSRQLLLINCVQFL